MSYTRIVRFYLKTRKRDIDHKERAFDIDNYCIYIENICYEAGIKAKKSILDAYDLPSTYLEILDKKEPTDNRLVKLPLNLKGELTIEDLNFSYEGHLFLKSSKLSYKYSTVFL